MSWIALCLVMDLRNGKISSRFRRDKRLATKRIGMAYATTIKKVGT